MPQTSRVSYEIAPRGERWNVIRWTDGAFGCECESLGLFPTKQDAADAAQADAASRGVTRPEIAAYD